MKSVENNRGDSQQRDGRLPKRQGESGARPPSRRVRIRFRKEGDLRWIGHRDLMRCLERLLRRAGLPLRFSAGFHPKPRLNVPAALAVGVASSDEVAEIELQEAITAAEVLAKLAPHMPAGLELRSVETVPPGAPKPRWRSACYEAALRPRHCALVAERIPRLLAAETWLVPRQRGRPPLDVRPLLESLSLRDGILAMRLRGDEKRQAGPRDVLRALGVPELEHDGVRLRRTRLELQEEAGVPASPPNTTPESKSNSDEERNVDQRLAAGGMPDRDR